MKTRCWAATLMLGCFVLWSVSVVAADKDQSDSFAGPGATIQLQSPDGIVTVAMPLSSAKYAGLVVAEINGEPIRLEELNGELMAMSNGDGVSQRSGHEDLRTILKRLVNIRLLEQEARNIGFDETPDFVKAEEQFKGQWLRTMLRSRQIQAVQPDEEEVTALYKEMSSSASLESVIFAKEEEAAKAVEAITGGASYQEVVKKALQDGTAQGSLLGARSYSMDQLMPQIADFVRGAEAGALSPVIPTGDGFSLVRVEEGVKSIDSPEILAQARQKLAAKKNLEVVRAYFETLKQKYAVVHQEILDSLDYGAEKPGLAALLKDDRVIIEIRDETPVTVAAFSQQLADNLYHGSDAKENQVRLNTMKNTLEENILFTRLFLKEALVLGLDKTEGFEKGIIEFERKTLFNTFINRVIVPEAKVSEEAVRRYYDEHLADYSSPKMLRMKSLVFDNGPSAQAALDLLRQNTDFKWLSANAEHQVDKNTEGLLQFDSNILSMNGLTQDVQELLADAKEGDYRLYPSPAGQFYVLVIEKVFPSTSTPYEDVRQTIAKQLFTQRIPELIEEWAVKLREIYEVKMYLVDTSNK